MGALECDGLRFTESEIERRKRFVGLQREDVPRLAEASAIVAARAGDYVAAFFEYLGRFEETAAFLARPQLVEEAKCLERDHLAAMMKAACGKDYLDQRLRLAKLYIDVGLPLAVLLGAYRHLLSTIGFDIVAHFANDPARAFRIFESIRKIGIFDMSIVDFLVDEWKRTIARHQHALRGLSIPVLQLRKGLLLLPLNGAVDARRAQHLTDELLSAARSTRAKVVVVDITGVASINGEVANHLVKAIEAARLLGLVVIVSGVSPAVAKTLVDLGVDLPAFDIAGDLQSGVERSERLLGYRVVPEPAAA
jgi:rsbT co-antagonist protein RsbR